MRFTTYSLSGLATALACGLALLGCTSAPMTDSIVSERDSGKLDENYSFVIGINKRDQMMGDAFTTSNAVPDATLARIKANANTDLGTQGDTFSYARDVNNNLWWASPNEETLSAVRSI